MTPSFQRSPIDRERAAQAKVRHTGGGGIEILFGAELRTTKSKRLEGGGLLGH